MDVTGIEPVTPACKAREGVKSKSLFRLRLTTLFHQNDTLFVAPKLLQGGAFRLEQFAAPDHYSPSKITILTESFVSGAQRQIQCLSAGP